MPGDLIASIRILQMLGNYEAFEVWLKEQHNKVLDAKLFQGYKFFVECAFSEFFDYLASEKILGIKDDLLFQRALGETFFIERLPNTCERVVFLKNIYSAYKPIAKAKNSNDLKEGIIYFQVHVLSIFDTLIEKIFDFFSVHELTSDRVAHGRFLEQIHLSEVEKGQKIRIRLAVWRYFRFKCPNIT